MITSLPPERLTIGELLKPSPENRYLIPRYQRNYSWGDKEIGQLIRDVADYRARRHKAYYIGTLVVHRRDDSGDFETVDGQQRLTTLTLVIAWLRREGIVEEVRFPQPVIHFQSRVNSDRVLHELFTLQRREVHSPRYTGGLEGIEGSGSLVDGFELVGKVFKEVHDDQRGGEDLKAWLTEFYHYLCSNVVIFRVHVPADTDLNHYFEVMNSRGEQLEKHEVLKASLMAELDAGDSSTFARIWDAASNMDRYLQMSFKTPARTALFGVDWQGFLPENFQQIRDVLPGEGNDGDAKGTGGPGMDRGNSLADILGKASDNDSSSSEDNDEKDHTRQFHSHIDFSNFLLHVLSLSVGKDGGNEPVTLDDKRLIEQFDQHITGIKEEEVKVAAIRNFAHHLLRARYLFDRFIVKRDLRTGREEWSMRRLKGYSSGSTNYVNAFGNDADVDDDDGTMDVATDTTRIIMLQAALQVSNSSHSFKYWMLDALRYLLALPLPDPVKAKPYLAHLEAMTRSFVSEIASGAQAASLDHRSESLRYGGVRSILFNFLDYLLWVGNRHRDFNDGKIRVDEFKFTYRSSVEHHAPQHPLNGTPNKFGDDVHRFGNLYLIEHGKNARLSNFDAESKEQQFLRYTTADSLKQQFMMDRTGPWDAEALARHEGQMLQLLQTALAEPTPWNEERLKVR
jgi:hypothetical protein